MIFNDLDPEEPSKGIFVSSSLSPNKVVESAVRKFRLDGDFEEYVIIELANNCKHLVCLFKVSKKKKIKIYSFN